jgi:hypothetical protein
MDRAQVMRWLADLGRCPSALLLHPALEASSAAGTWLRLRDTSGPAGAVVEVEIGPEGAPVVTRGMRPSLQGRKFVVRPWSGKLADHEVFEGLRMPTRLEASWEYPEGEFVGYRATTTPVRAVR